LIDDTVYSTSNIPVVEADLNEFIACATAQDMSNLIPHYISYSSRARSTNDTTISTLQSSAFPGKLHEFYLYLEGVREMHADSGLIAPPSWLELLELDAGNRQHRTSWVYYMLGNLASSHGKPKIASLHYAACRQAVNDGFSDSIGLAGSSYKQEFSAQTNSVDWIRCGVQAVAYYRFTQDYNKLHHCFDHLKQYFDKLSVGSVNDLVTSLSLECAAVFMSGTVDKTSTALMQKLAKSTPLKVTSRLAWFMYDRGEVERATQYLKSCPDDDLLANWIRFRITQRNGDFTEAIDYLKRWLDEIGGTDRVIFGYCDQYYRLPQSKAVHGVLGNLLVTQGQLQEAMNCFINAGSYHDAALIAERYIDTDSLKSFVDALNLSPSTKIQNRYYYKEIIAENCKQDILYLLARRLFRDNRLTESLSYYPLELHDLVQAYQTALIKSRDTSLSNDIRASHLFHASRIMRWKGMEICGTELRPDYRIVNGSYGYYGFDEENTALSEFATTYKMTSPNPNVRFHYRQIAFDHAVQAVKLTGNRHQRALILWCAGNLIKFKDAVKADVYYKQLARIKRSSLAKSTYDAHWFAPSTPALESTYKSLKYIEPEVLIKEASDY